ncbi:MAG: C10 family peptidase, partial [Candidatus Eisenbacteria bacterium]
MPDSCDFGCSTDEEIALGELCYEVGVAFNMDYGVCGSGAYTADALTVFPTYFGYHPGIDREDRGDYANPVDWWNIIRDQINVDQPIQYRIIGHSIVCDGWQDVGPLLQYHINYGWAGPNTGWFTIDNIPGSADPVADEYLIRHIIPQCTPNNDPVAVCQNPVVNADPVACAVDVSVDGGSFDPDGDAITLTQSPPGPYGVGMTPVTLTVEDEHGCTDECEATVTVVDVTPPLITCPGDVTVECSDHCGTPASDPQLIAFFAGVSASDACDASVLISDDRPPCFPLGPTTVTFTATDDANNQSSCQPVVTVIDTTPPEISIEADPDYLWPPNHKMVDIEVTATVDDVCDDDPVVLLDTIWSNEPDDGNGDGSFPNDIQACDPTYPCEMFEFQLRSERMGGGDGRVYTIVYSATDVSGNTAYDTAEVVVPHDQSGHALASTGFNRTGTDFGMDPKRFSLVIPGVADALFQLEGGIEINRVKVGSHLGTLAPVSHDYRFADGDELLDLEVFYDVASAELLRSDGSETYALSLRYPLPDGVYYLVWDIFALGPPLEFTGVAMPGEDGAALPVKLYLPTPNPFGESTRMSYAVTSRAGAPVNIGIYNVAGERVRDLVSSHQGSGVYEVTWDGRNNAGTAVPSGVYFYRTLVGDRQEVTRVVIMR